MLFDAWFQLQHTFRHRSDWVLLGHWGVCGGMAASQYLIIYLSMSLSCCYVCALRAFMNSDLAFLSFAFVLFSLFALVSGQRHPECRSYASQLRLNGAPLLAATWNIQNLSCELRLWPQKNPAKRSQGENSRCLFRRVCLAPLSLLFAFSPSNIRRRGWCFGHVALFAIWFHFIVITPDEAFCTIFGAAIFTPRRRNFFFRNEFFFFCGEFYFLSEAKINCRSTAQPSISPSDKSGSDFQQFNFRHVDAGGWLGYHPYNTSPLNLKVSEEFFISCATTREGCGLYSGKSSPTQV